MISAEDRKTLVDLESLVICDLIARHSDFDFMQSETVRLRCGGEVFGGAPFTEEQAKRLMDLAYCDGDAFDVAQRIVMITSNQGKLTERLREFRNALLLGEIERPRNRHRPLETDDYVRVLIKLRTRDLVKHQGLPLSHDRATKNLHKNTACDIMADALRTCGDPRFMLSSERIKSMFVRGRFKKY